MALSIVEILTRYGHIDQDALARSFGDHFERGRGYGTAMYDLLPQLRAGHAWRSAAPALFGGQGSFGNGAAMRVAPLGACFADNIPTVIDQAIRSAEVTHAHPEAIAGAIAVAVATAQAWRRHQTGEGPEGTTFIERVTASIAFLRYHQLPGAEPTYVYLAGLGLAATASYPHVIRTPTLSRYRAIIPDWLGCGFSDRPATFGYTISEHATSIAALLDDLQLANCIVIGASMGGAVFSDRPFIGSPSITASINRLYWFEALFEAAVEDVFEAGAPIPAGVWDKQKTRNTRRHTFVAVFCPHCISKVPVGLVFRGSSRAAAR